LHMVRHAAENPNQCAVCSTRFPSKEALFEHLETHAKKDEETLDLETWNQTVTVELI